MYTEVFKLNCSVTPGYYVYEPNSCDHTGCTTHEDAGGYSNKVDTGCDHHLDSGYDDYSDHTNNPNSGCSNHYDNGGYDDHYDTGPSTCNDHSEYYERYSCTQYNEAHENFPGVHNDSGYSDHANYRDCTDSGYANHTEYGCDNHTDYGYNDHSNTAVCSHSGCETHLNSPPEPGGGCSNHTDTGCTTHEDAGGYNNHYDVKFCEVNWNYINYTDAQNPSTGGSLQLNEWPSTIWDDQYKFKPEFIKDSIDGLKNICDNIDLLIKNKGRNNISNDSLNSVNSSLDNSKDVPVKSSEWNSVVTSLQSLFKNLKNKNIEGELPNISSSNIIRKKDFENLRYFTDKLASDPITYVNYADKGFTAIGSELDLPTQRIPLEIIKRSDQSQETLQYIDYKDVQYGSGGNCTNT